MSKRNNDEEVAISRPRKKPHFDPVGLNSKSTEFSKYDNKRLAQRLVQKNKLVVELRNKITRLDQRQTENDLVSIVIKAINRYWDRWDEDFHLLLQKYDSESVHNFKRQDKRENTDCLLHFPKADVKEFSKNLSNRQELSKQAVGKIIETFEKLMEKKEKLSLAIKGELELDEGEPKMYSVIKEINEQLCTENQNLQDLNSKLFCLSKDMISQLDGLKRTTVEKEMGLKKMRNQFKELQNENKLFLEQNNQLETQLAESLEVKTMGTVDKTAHEQEKPNYGESELDKLDVLVKTILNLSNSPCVENDSFDSDDSDNNANTS
ncbi:E3 ubiquitin-protein ligase Bre1-like [Adelges cooleyi]|uniref:E3 ubiquitin-protein ligase Bre1-like n=1 Tax=Adelges cooleyi TaxID=133065 RepID=UPI00217F5D91|nr:E3 ubiquitin-protein ligase Bre1-like [Adelges cooleyi]